MSVDNRSELAPKPVTGALKTGVKVEILKLSSMKNLFPPLEEIAVNETVRLLEMFHGIIELTPEHAGDDIGYWKIREVVKFELGSGAVSSCADLSFANNDMSFIVSRIFEEPSEDQLALDLALTD